jgi:hypothetical protein
MDFLKRNWSQISLLICLFFAVSAGALSQNPWLVGLDLILTVYWANEFVKSIKAA